MRKCESCGKLYQESKDVFCPHCGAVAQKQCTHGSSFDSSRYDRGEIYKNESGSTAYNQGVEPHIQREKYLYNRFEDTFGDAGQYSDKTPKIEFPDLSKMLSKTKGKSPKSIGIIIFICIIAFNFIIGSLSFNEGVDVDSWEESEVMYFGEDVTEFYTVVNEASIEIIDTNQKAKTFVIEIKCMEFEENLPESVQSAISSGEMGKDILSDDTFVEILPCSFSKKEVDEESYDSAVNESFYSPGEQIDGKCKYKFIYDFDYDEIVHIAGGIDFRLENGVYINAQLPFSAFSVSEDGIITYYSSYANEYTKWSTVFTECSNKQAFSSDVYINFEEVVTVVDNEE